MRKIDETKLAKLSTTNKMLDDKYGTRGTETRNEFDEQSLAWFYGNMLKSAGRFIFILSFTAPYTLHNFAAKEADYGAF